MKQLHTHAVGPCPNCGHGNATPDGRLTVPCTNCGTKITLKRVVGVYVDARDCDGSCLGATGNVCACNCGGANHGRGYSPGTYVGDVADFDLARAQQRNAKRHETMIENRLAKAQAKIDKLHSEIDALTEAHPHLAFLVTDAYEVTEQARENDFYRSLAEQLLRGGYLSERQIDALGRSIIRKAEAEQRRVEREAEAAQLIAAGVRVRAGRYKITGEIVHVKLGDGPYAQWKMILRSEEGWRLYCTVPAALVDMVREQRENYEDFDVRLRKHFAGRKITFTATVTPSKDDQLFGFGNRPTNATVAEVVTA